MNTITCTTETRVLLPRTTAATGIKTLFSHLLKEMWAWNSRIGSRRALGRLDDRLLQDIGLTRADVYRETVKPFWIA